MSGWNPGPGPTAGRDTFQGGSSADSVGALGGDDLLLGGAGNDTLSGGAGNDRVGGDSDDDVLFGEEGADTIEGGGGRDLLYGGTGGDSLLGDNQTDTLIGGLGADYLFGGNQEDMIFTGAAVYDSVTGTWSMYDDNGESDTVNEAGNQSDTAYAGIGDYLTGGGHNLGDGGDRLFIPVNFSTVPTGQVVVIGSDTFDQIFVETTPGADGVRDTIYATQWEVIGRYTPSTSPCFATGTRIATSRGEVAVEDLRVGDMVVTSGGRGAVEPVIWLGHAEVNIARHARPEAVAPILIRAGALGEGVPFRDLRVSPDHALFLDGCLVPAGLLVNGRTIIREAWCPAVTYWHVELPRHAVLLAEGAAAESYLDDGNRKHFDNGAIASLFQDFASERGNGVYDREACYPVLREGEGLAAIRARLAARAEALRGQASQAPRRA